VDLTPGKSGGIMVATTNRRTGAFFMPWGYFHNPIFANKERRIARVDECPAFGW